MSARRKAWFLAGACALAVAALGPRERSDGRVPEVILPADVEAYVRDRETAVPDLTPGAEATIIRAPGYDGPLRKTPLAVVYLHGFSATRQETAPLADSVAALLGAHLYYPRLSGHGRPGSALAGVTAEDWLRDAAEALAVGLRLGDRVVLIGTSTGGTLATWLAARHPDAPEIAAVVLVSPNFGPADPRSEMLLWPWGRQLLGLFESPWREWKPANEQQARYWTTRYPAEAVLPMMALVGLVRSLPLEHVRTPVQLLYSSADEVVDPRRSLEVFGRLGSSTRIARDVGVVGVGSNHVIAGRILAPEATRPMAREIADFVRGATGEEAGRDPD